MSQTLKTICKTLVDALERAPKYTLEEEGIYHRLGVCLQQAASEAGNPHPPAAAEQALPTLAARPAGAPSGAMAPDLIERVQQLELENQQLQQQLAAAGQGRDDAQAEAQARAYVDLSNILWPDYLRLPELAPYYAQWEDVLLGKGEDEFLRCMFASIFMWDSYMAMSRVEADMEQHVMNSLQNISRFFFAWAESQEISSYESLHFARLISERLNVILEQRGFLYTIYLPELDMPYVSSSMLPSVKGERTGDVAAVHAWGLYNERGNLYPRKCIVVLSNESHVPFT